MKFGAALAPLDGAQVDWAEIYRQQRTASQFVVLLLVPLAILTVLARFKLGTEPQLLTVAFMAAACSLRGPIFLGRWLGSDKLRALWFGPLAILSLFVALLPTYLGHFGVVVVLALGLAAGILSAGTTAALSRGILLMVPIASIYLAFEIGGNKYANFFADRLALFGRTDGDIFAQGAIVGSIRSYGWPSFAIDGLEPLKYHVGALWLAARLQAAGGGDYIVAVVAAKIFVLVPLLIFAALQAAILFNAILRPDRAASAVALIAAVGIVIFVLPYAGIGFATFDSETMSLGALLALLAFPGLYLLGSDAGTSRKLRHGAWALAALAFFLLCAAKISMAFVLALVFAWWLLRIEGLRSLAFWLWGSLGFLAFLGGFLVFNDRDSMGAQIFGKPYYVEYGFERGEWWIPLTHQFETIAALLILAFARGRSPARRLTLETLMVAAVAGNLPGLLMYIQSGNAAYFLVSQAWVAIPVLAALLPGAWDALASRLRAAHRLAPAAALVVAMIGAGYASYSELRTRASLFLAAKALLTSGDTSYYAEDRRRAWREDAKRAVAEFGLPHLLTAPGATPPAADLVLGLRRLRAEHGAGLALYVPESNAEYWNLVADCDGKSVFPVAEAGLAMIQGYAPAAANCEMEIALRGFHADAAAPRAESTPKAICARAEQKAFTKVAWLETLDVKDAKILDCAAVR